MIIVVIHTELLQVATIKNQNPAEVNSLYKCKTLCLPQIDDELIIKSSEINT